MKLFLCVFDSIPTGAMFMVKIIRSNYGGLFHEELFSYNEAIFELLHHIDISFGNKIRR
jgi:hypothetical protein